VWPRYWLESYFRIISISIYCPQLENYCWDFDAISHGNYLSWFNESNKCGVFDLQLWNRTPFGRREKSSESAADEVVSLVDFPVQGVKLGDKQATGTESTVCWRQIMLKNISWRKHQTDESILEEGGWNGNWRSMSPTCNSSKSDTWCMQGSAGELLLRLPEGAAHKIPMSYKNMLNQQRAGVE